MMKKITLILFSILVTTFISTDCLSQQSNEWPIFKGRDSFSDYVRTQLGTDSGLGMVECVKLVTALKFSIDERGFATDIQVSENVRGYIRQKLMHIARSSDGTWDMAKLNGKPIKSKPMVVLIYLDLAGSCKKETNFTAINKVTETFQDLFKINEKDETMSLEDVKILTPVVFLSPNGLNDLSEF